MSIFRDCSPMEYVAYILAVGITLVPLVPYALNGL